MENVTKIQADQSVPLWAQTHTHSRSESVNTVQTFTKNSTDTIQYPS